MGRLAICPYLVACGLDGAGLVHMDVPGVGAQHALPRLERRRNDGQIRLGRIFVLFYLLFRKAPRANTVRPCKACDTLLRSQKYASF